MFVYNQLLSTTLLLLVPFGSNAVGLKGSVMKDKNLTSSSNHDQFWVDENKNLTFSSSDNDHNLVGEVPYWCQEVPGSSTQVCHGDDEARQEKCWNWPARRINKLAFEINDDMHMTFIYGVDCHTECQPFWIGDYHWPGEYDGLYMINEEVTPHETFDTIFVAHAGRQKSKGPGMCFISGLGETNVLGTCDPSDKTPKELNFSLNLDITFWWNDHQVFFLRDFRMGQGSNSGCNNWWIGHKDCWRLDDESLRCKTNQESGVHRIPEFTFTVQDSNKFKVSW